MLLLSAAACTSSTSGSGDPVVNEGQVRIDALVASCNVPDYAHIANQIVVNRSYQWLIDNHKEKDLVPLLDVLSCLVASASPAGQAVLESASGVSGPQSVTENGIVYTQIYNSASNVLILTLQAEA